MLVAISHLVWGYGCGSSRKLIQVPTPLPTGSEGEFQGRTFPRGPLPPAKHHLPRPSPSLIQTATGEDKYFHWTFCF